MSDGDSEYSKLGEILELTRENNRILRSMHRRMMWSQVFTFVYWLLILGAMGWSYYFLQPYLTKYWTTYQNIMEAVSTLEVGGQAIPGDIGNFLKK